MYPRWESSSATWAGSWKPSSLIERITHGVVSAPMRAVSESHAARALLKGLRVERQSIRLRATP